MPLSFPCEMQIQNFHRHRSDGFFEIVIFLPPPLHLLLMPQKGALGAQKIQLLKQSKETSDPVIFLVREARLPKVYWMFSPSPTLCWVITEEDSVLVKLNCSVVREPFIAACPRPFHLYYQLQSLLPFPSSIILFFQVVLCFSISFFPWVVRSPP